MRTYTIDWEREAYQAENLTYDELIETLAELIVDDQKESEDKVCFDEILQRYYIDVYEDGAEVEIRENWAFAFHCNSGYEDFWRKIVDTFEAKGGVYAYGDE